MNIDFLENLYNSFDETIKKHNYDMLMLMIYYNCSLFDDVDFRKMSTEEKAKIIQFIHKAYLKDESYIDLGHICDIAMENYKKILKCSTFTVYDLLSLC